MSIWAIIAIGFVLYLLFRKDNKGNNRQTKNNRQIVLSVDHEEKPYYSYTSDCWNITESIAMATPYLEANVLVMIKKTHNTYCEVTYQYSTAYGSIPENVVVGTGL